MMHMTLVEIDAICSAEVEHTFDRINEGLYIAYQQAAMTGIATNNPKRFPRKAPRIKNKAAHSEVADPKVIYNKVWQIAAMCGLNLNEPAGT